MIKETAICKLVAPATCENRIDGKMAWVALCGGNKLSEHVVNCPMRQKATISYEEGK
jgi:hypothetical protein